MRIRSVVSGLMLIFVGCVPAGAPSPKRLAGLGADASQPAPRPTLDLDAGSTGPVADSGPWRSPPPPPSDAGPAAPPPPPPADAGTTPPPNTPDMCIDGPNKPLPAVANVYYGTTEPTHVPATPGQILAIGSFNGCSGTLIAPTWVLSASHCNFRTGASFCMGEDPSNPNVCFRSTRVIDNPRADMSLVELREDATQRLPQVEPIALLNDDMDSAWIGRIVEASGYGRQETGRSGEREFTAEPISSMRGTTVTINGEGRHGVCFGDSGGPLLAIASDGSVRIGGVLSNGDPSCTGYDNYTRVDLQRDWIERYVGPTAPPGPQPCGSVTDEGSCNPDRTRATYCESGVLQVANCAGGDVCAWSAPASGYRCIPAANDPCGGLTDFGTCDDNNVLTWCDQGRLMRRDCQACGEACIPMSSNRGHFCLPSNCGDLTFRGRCEGNQAVWCNRDAQRQSRNCNNGCGWIDDATGYYCR